MIKKLLFLLTLIVFVVTANSQTIAKWKIEDVVKSCSATNDTVYVVNFWATFCKPCIAEIPDFIRIVDKYKDQKVKLLLVSLDLPGFYPNKIEDFVKKNNYYTNIVWLDETNADHFCPAIDKKWSGAIPSTIIVNNKTGYKKFVEDQMSPELFEASIKEAVGGRVFNYMAPMNDAEITATVFSNEGDIQRNYLSFKSNDSAVYAVAGGKVNMIARVENMKVVIIEKDGLFFTYSNLGSTLVKQGDVIKTDQLIGYATRELDGDKPTVEFYLNDADKSITLTRENFIARKDKRLSDHSFDPVNEPK